MATRGSFDRDEPGLAAAHSSVGARERREMVEKLSIQTTPTYDVPLSRTRVRILRDVTRPSPVGSCAVFAFPRTDARLPRARHPIH